MEKEQCISLKDVRFRYRRSPTYALDGIDLDISKGEFVAVIGPSQAGKSTLCLLLNGLIPHVVNGKLEGTVIIDGMDTSSHKCGELYKSVAMVFQDFEAQLFSTCAALDVAFPAENKGVPYEMLRELVHDCLERVDMLGFEMRQPALLSGGQKQRLAIASALAADTPILVLDEPTTDLDPVGKKQVISIATGLQNDRGRTIICVEHEIEEMVNASRIILVSKGKIVLDGKPEEVFPQVDVFHNSGIMPLGTCELLNRLGIKETIFTVEETAKYLLDKGYAISDNKYQELLEVENNRNNRYGDVIIDVNHISFSYVPGNKVVDDVSFQIRAGEFVAFMGQNGSGKTTLAKQLNGLLINNEGSVQIMGKEVKDTGIFNLSKYISYVFQNPDHQIFASTIFDEVAFGPRNFGMAEDEIKSAVTNALDAVGLAGREEEDPFSLTKGERQRVAVASVLSMNPKIIILDEPTTGMDYAEQVGIMEMLKGFNEKGCTVIIITHTMWVVTQYAHRAIVINKGKIVLDGSVREVFSQEEELKSLYLEAPQIVQIGNRFGKPLLSVDEGVSCLTNEIEIKKESEANEF